jgi:hypothetical protein
LTSEGLQNSRSIPPEFSDSDLQVSQLRDTSNVVNHHPDLHAEHYQQTVNTICNLHLLKLLSHKYQLLPKVYLPDVDRAIWQRWQPPTGEHVNAKVLFLDIDETMIHCIDDRDPVSMRGETKLRIGLNTEQPNQRT